MKTTRTLSAFQGRGWRPRRGALAAEISSGRGIWASRRVDSEYGKLDAVVLHCPGRELRGISSPNRIQHAGRIDAGAVKKEYARLASVYRRLGVEVHFLPAAFSGSGWPVKFNLMYVRDLFFMTREGAVVSRMASAVRSGEEKHAALALAALGVPINRTVSGSGLFEGADALWLDPQTVLVGVGNRTNREGFRQLSETLRAQGVKAVAVALPRSVQHLLGLLQIVDRDLVLLRVEIAPRGLAGLLARRGFAVVEVPETEETISGQGMNLVTLAPRKLLMPAGCPELKRLYRGAGLVVAAEVDVRQILQGAGGLACATGILARRV